MSPMLTDDLLKSLESGPRDKEVHVDLRGFCVQSIKVRFDGSESSIVLGVQEKHLGGVLQHVLSLSPPDDEEKWG